VIAAAASKPTHVMRSHRAARERQAKREQPRMGTVRAQDHRAAEHGGGRGPDTDRKGDEHGCREQVGHGPVASSGLRSSLRGGQDLAHHSYLQMGRLAGRDQSRQTRGQDAALESCYPIPTFAIGPVAARQRSSTEAWRAPLTQTRHIPVILVAAGGEPGVDAIVARVVGTAKARDTAVIAAADVAKGALAQLGCACCRPSSDVKQALFELWSRRRTREIEAFQRVVIVLDPGADPAPVVMSLLTPPSSAIADQIVANQFGLARLITVLDALTDPEVLDADTPVARQIALADAVVVTRDDQAHDPATARDLARLFMRTRQLNPTAQILLGPELERSALQLLQAGRYEDAARSIEADGELAPSVPRVAFTSQLLVLDEPIAPQMAFFLVEALKSSPADHVVRVRGLLALADDPARPLVVHGVRHFAQTVDRLAAWPSPDRRSRLLITGRTPDIAAFRRILSATTPATTAAAAFA
jgi:G3E family GTPase